MEESGNIPSWKINMTLENVRQTRIKEHGRGVEPAHALRRISEKGLDEESLSNLAYLLMCTDQSTAVLASRVLADLAEKVPERVISVYEAIGRSIESIPDMLLHESITTLMRIFRFCPKRARPVLKCLTDHHDPSIAMSARLVLMQNGCDLVEGDGN